MQLLFESTVHQELFGRITVGQDCSDLRKEWNFLYLVFREVLNIWDMEIIVECKVGGVIRGAFAILRRIFD
jgi:hypothetical protein